MGKRQQILLGMGGGLLWAAVLPFLPGWLGLGREPALMGLLAGAVAPGLFLALVIGFLAQRRFFDDALIDGQPYPPGSSGEIAQRVLSNTVEQLLLAVALWPFIAVQLGGTVVFVMGLSFAAMRVTFWAGYAVSPPLRAFGFAGTFYPTVVAALYALGMMLS